MKLWQSQSLPTDPALPFQKCGEVDGMTFMTRSRVDCADIDMLLQGILRSGLGSSYDLLHEDQACSPQRRPPRFSVAVGAYVGIAVFPMILEWSHPQRPVVEVENPFGTGKAHDALAE